MECDVAVLGGGPGGYPAAIRAAQLGANVVLVEQGRIGGTCITVGCIPTKTWVQTAHALKEAHETFAKIGVNVSGAELDFPRAQENKEGIVSGLVNGITGVVKANGITAVQGRGSFRDAEHDRDRGRRGHQVQAGHHRHGQPLAATAGGRHRRAALPRFDGSPRDHRGAQAPAGAGRRRDRRRVCLDHAPLGRRGDDRRDARPADPDGGRRRLEGAAAHVQEARHHLSPGHARARRGGRQEGRDGHLPGRRRQRRRGRGRPGAGGNRPRPIGAQHRPRGGRSLVRSPHRRRRRPAHAHERAAHLCRGRRRGRLPACPHLVSRG